jgi:valyl-tRNA synthetase
LFAHTMGQKSIHTSQWPAADPRLEDDAGEKIGEMLLQAATAVRRFKSEHNLPLGSELAHVQLVVHSPDLLAPLAEANADLKSITRAANVSVTQGVPDPGLEIVAPSDGAQDERMTVALSL